MDVDRPDQDRQPSTVAKERPRRIVLQAGPPPSINLTCYGFHVWAQDFLAAAKLYAPAARKGSFVPQFLCCQSIELSLKGFLSLKGVTRANLRKDFGHNLIKLYDGAIANGIGTLVTLRPEDGDVVAKANNAYDSRAGKRLQYFDAHDAATAFKNLPELSGLEDLASRLQAQALRDALLAG